MNTLKIPVSCIGGAGYDFEECAPVASIQPSGTKSLPVETVSVSGKFTKSGESYMFRGIVSGVYQESCCRCLAPAVAPFHTQVTWVFEEGPEAVLEEIGHPVEEEAFFSGDANTSEPGFTYQGPEINLAPYVWEEVVFAEPSRYLCREDCKGLCPQCGGNLNVGACACDGSARSQLPSGNQGLAVLAKLFPELAPDTKKE